MEFVSLGANLGGDQCILVYPIPCLESSMTEIWLTGGLSLNQSIKFHGHIPVSTVQESTILQLYFLPYLEPQNLQII